VSVFFTIYKIFFHKLGMWGSGVLAPAILSVGIRLAGG